MKEGECSIPTSLCYNADLSETYCKAVFVLKKSLIIIKIYGPNDVHCPNVARRFIQGNTIYLVI